MKPYETHIFPGGHQLIGPAMGSAHRLSPLPGAGGRPPRPGDPQRGAWWAEPGPPRVEGPMGMVIPQASTIGVSMGLSPPGFSMGKERNF